ncbi:Keratin, type I cytoskeletal 19 [Pteropus alecto]|uniref:Keratin, type I cytoskeletal 19 n=1 Tax=Pteropus alecto TaxID=9402 RepID=L5K357_PTEAL|nr:Keratin, type I cytoskeletal 19 [Pteropus alecto]
MLSYMRRQSEVMAEKNQKDAEAWFTSQTEEMNREQDEGHQPEAHPPGSGDQAAVSAQGESCPGGHAGRNGGLLWSLAGTDPGPNVSTVAQRSDVRAEIEQQNLEYQQLMDIKTWLEQEITTYCSLLEGQDTYYNNLPTT